VIPPFPTPWIWPYSPGVAWEIEPSGIYANSTLRFCKILEQYPATYWTLEYGMVPWAGATTGPILFDSAPLNGGNIHLIDVVPAVTAQWAPGRYSWQVFAQVTSDGATALGIDPTTRNYLSKGLISVFPDLTTAGAVDTRGRWQKILDEIDQMIESIAGDTQEEISIGRGTIAGQSLKGWDREKLLAFRDYAMHMAGNEQRIKNGQAGAPNPRYKYAVMTGGGQGYAWNGFPDVIPFS